MGNMDAQTDSACPPPPPALTPMLKALEVGQSCTLAIEYARSARRIAARIAKKDGWQFKTKKIKGQDAIRIWRLPAVTGTGVSSVEVNPPTGEFAHGYEAGRQHTPHEEEGNRRVESGQDEGGGGIGSTAPQSAEPSRP